MAGQRISTLSILWISSANSINWDCQTKLKVCGGDTWSIQMPKENPIKGFGTLTPLQKEFMDILANLPDKDQFYLAGGTALSEYYLGHRLSFDLDYFTGAENLILPLSYQIETACQKKGVSLKVVRRFSTFVELLAEKDNESLKIDIALDSPFRFEMSVLSNEGIYINDYPDLRVDKLL